MSSFTISSNQHREVIDITDTINEFIHASGVEAGICHVFVNHTTCCLTTADLDPGTDLDFLDAIEQIFPAGNYRHPHDPAHVGEHIMASIIGNAVTLPIRAHQLLLGTWQRVVLVELSGPRTRDLQVAFTRTESR